MQPEAVIFGCATFAALLLSLRGSVVSQGCAWALVAVYGAANLLWEAYALDWLPLVDLPAAMLFYAVLIVRPSMWALCLAVVFAFRLPLHVAADWGVMPMVPYLYWINAAFLAALIAVSWEGGAHAFRGLLGAVYRICHVRRPHLAALHVGRAQ